MSLQAMKRPPFVVVGMNRLSLIDAVQTAHYGEPSQKKTPNQRLPGSIKLNRPLQRQRQRRPPEGGRYNGNDKSTDGALKCAATTAKSTPTTTSAVWLDAQDSRRRLRRVEFCDDCGAAIEDGALVQRAFVGDFSGVERWRLFYDYRAGDARGAAGGICCARFEQGLKVRADLWMRKNIGGGCLGLELRAKRAAGVGIGEN